jgi:V8-like Glu-specific endopeptidase
MKLTLILTVLAISAFGCVENSKSKHKNIYGTDNRVLVSDGATPFKAIGKLDVGCTGTMIGKKLMLTAGHCIIKDNSSTPRADFKNFVANMTNGVGAGIASPVRAWVGGITPEQDRRMDWAIVELSTPLGEAQGTIAVSSKDLTSFLPYQVNLGGYNSDLGGGITPSVHWGCNVRSIVEGKLHHDCDATAGISGAPLFAKEDERWIIVGISVSEFRQNQNPPIHREDWSEDYANVGTPATMFASTAESLLLTVDEGLVAPTLPDGIISVTFESISTPQPQPQLPPALDPSPPSPFGIIPYELSQIGVLAEIYAQITMIHNLHWALLEDAGRFGFMARASRIPYYVNISDVFSQVLDKHVIAYNRLAQFGPTSMSREYLYQVYVALKSGQNQMQTIDLNFLPLQIRFDTVAAQTVTAGHLSQLEWIIFHQ